MASTTPLARATALAGSKRDLIEKVKSLATEKFWVSRLSGDKAWNGLSNAKLLRLHTVLTEATKRFGSRVELIDSLATAEGHGRDGDYKKALEAWPLPRLMDALGAAERRVRRAAKAAKKS
jgi:hypothetical protein